MPLSERIALYAEIERIRQRPIIAYVTSNRRNASGVMSSDALPDLLDQILHLPPGADAVDLLVVSNGGDPTTAWRIISALRERVSKIGVLIPQAAFSAATLLALGADEILMHACGNLGPVDPQISVQRARPGGVGNERIDFGSEDLAAFLAFVRSEVGLSDQEQLKAMFQLFCQEAGTVPIGIAARASQLAVSMGEKLLRMHMTDDADGQKARAIAETLNKKFFHHGYPVGRKEAKDIGLKVIIPDPELENLLWRVWTDLESDLQCREPFNFLTEIEKSPVGQTLLAPIPQVTIPGGITQNLVNQLVAQIMQQVQVLTHIDPVDYQKKLAIIESPRKASAYVRRGKIYARRESDLRITINDVVLFEGWGSNPLPSSN